MVDLVIHFILDIIAVLEVVGGRQAEVESDHAVAVLSLQGQPRSGPNSQPGKRKKYFLDYFFSGKNM